MLLAPERFALEWTGLSWPASRWSKLVAAVSLVETECDAERPDIEWSREFDCEMCVEAGTEGAPEEEEDEPELLSCPP